MSTSFQKSKRCKKWRDAIWVTEKILSFTEIWPSEDESLFRSVKIGFFLLICIIFDITLIDELKTLLMKQEYEALAMHMSTFALYIGYTVKIVLFQFRKGPQLKSMLKSIDQPIFDDYPIEMQKYKNNCIKISNGMAIFYIACVAASILMYLNKPLYTEYPLPITFSHELNSLAYYAVLAMQCFCCYYLVIIGICFDMIVVGLINIATAQLDILGEEISTFQTANLLVELQEGEEYEFLRKCSQRHQATIQFVNEIEDVFTFIFLAQSLTTVLSMSNGLFQLAHTGKLFSIHFYFNCAFTFDILFEIGICCWFATLLTTKSLEVSDACYNYDWLNSSTSVKKQLLIIQFRSQTPLYISAGKIMRLSMSSFLQVLKTAYSYFALMQSLYDKKNSFNID